MAGTTVGDLNIRLNLELQRLDAQIAQSNAKIARMGKSWHNDIGKAAKRINSTLATIGAGVSIGGLVSFGKSVLDLGGQLVDLSYQAGINTDAFQDFRAVAMESGATGEQVADMFAKMRKSVQESAEGNVTLSKAFDTLNLNAQALRSLAPEAQFELIARAVSSAADKQAAYNAASDIFGAKIAPKMMQFIDAIAGGGLVKAQAELANVRLTADQLRTLDEAGDKLARMWDYIKLIGAKGIVIAASTPKQEEQAKLLNVNTPLDQWWKAATSGVEQPTPAAPMSQPDLSAEQARQAAAAQRARDMEQAKADAEYMEAMQKEINAGVAEAAKIEVEAAKESAEYADKHFAAMQREDAQLNQVAESARRLIDPSREYRAEVEQINEALEANKLSSEEAAQATAAVWKSYDDAQKKANGAQDAARELGMTFSSAFEDAVLEGKKLSEVLKGIGNDILRIILRKQVTEPLANSISGMFSGGGGGGGGGLFGLIGGLGSLLGFADGGRPPLGRASIVGEDGPELFVPDSAGTIVSNSRLAEAAGGGERGGISVSIVQKFEAGVSQSQLAEGLRQTYEASKAGVMDAIHRRRGGFGALKA